MGKRFTKANVRGLRNAVEDLRALDQQLRQGRGATNRNIRRQKRDIYEFLSKQGIPIDDVIKNNIRRSREGNISSIYRG